MKKTYNTLKSENNLKLISCDKEILIFIEDEVLPPLNKRKFSKVNFENASYEEDGELVDGIVLYFSNQEYVEDIFNILSNREDNNFHRIFIELNDIFSFESEVNKYEFRGDFGEALFLHMNNGTRTKDNNDIFDIFDEEGNQVEIKTYSNQNKYFTISHEQLMNGNEIYIVPLIFSNEGITIIELAEEINDKEFSIYIKNKYKNSRFENYRFRITKPSLFDKKIKLDYNLPKEIKKATYEIFIA